MEKLPSIKEIINGKKSKYLQEAEILLSFGYEEISRPKLSVIKYIRLVESTIRENIDKGVYSRNPIHDSISDINFLCGKISEYDRLTHNLCLDTFRVSPEKLSIEYLHKRLSSKGNFDYEHRLTNPKTRNVFYIGFTSKREL